MVVFTSEAEPIAEFVVAVKDTPMIKTPITIVKYLLV